MERTNGVREAVESDNVAIGAATSTHSAIVVESYGHLGFDFAWLDFEHTGPSPYDASVFEELSRAAEVSGVELLVRLPTPDPHLVRKVLDAGVRTLLIPRIETAVEARKAVAATQFTYDGEPGERGIGLGRSSRWGANMDGYVDREDRSVLLGVMIETRRAVENLEDILAVPGLGFVFVGPADLSVSMGDPLATDSPAIQNQIERIRRTTTQTDVPLGGIASDVTEGRDMIKDGYQLLRVGSELSAARSVLGDRLAELR